MTREVAENLATQKFLPTLLRLAIWPGVWFRPGLVFEGLFRFVKEQLIAKAYLLSCQRLLVGFFIIFVGTQQVLSRLERQLRTEQPERGSDDSSSWPVDSTP